ncbi:MAG TPA: TetR/AcrR family transcriptional regulator [Solirubrobacterales bacterium]|nr:TetR/AcrR family transcriptional regulator [Solirubrobacterales bacterium]
MTRSLTRKEKQERTRSSLLRSAAKLICRKGIGEASVDEIASDAGYTKGAFYANFKSKEEMFLVMLDEAYAAELDRLEAHLPGDQHVEEVRQSAEDFMQFVRSDPEWPRLYFEFVVYAARNPDFREELATRNRAMRERIAEVIRRWTADLGEPPFPFEDIAMMLFSLADGFLVQQLVEPDVDESLYATMNETLFKGIVASGLDLDMENLAEVQEAKARKAGAGR